METALDGHHLGRPGRLKSRRRRSAGAVQPGGHDATLVVTASIARRSVLRRHRLEQELDDELRYHYERQLETHVSAGLSLEDARFAALRAMGPMELAKDQCRDARGAMWIQQAIQDVGYALRTMRAAPQFTFVAVLTLALGIGATTALFSVMYAVVVRPLPYPEPNRLVRVWSTMPARGFAEASSSIPDYRLFRDHTRTLAALAAMSGTSYTLTTPGAPERVRGTRATASLQRVLRSHVVLGRWFSDAEEQWGQHRVAVISEGLWQRRFGSDPRIVGRTVRLDDESYTVLGVMPASFSLPNAPSDLWTPLSFPPDSTMNTRSNSFLDLFGRLAPGVTPAQATADLIAVVRPVNPDVGAQVEDLRESIVGDVRPTMNLLLGAVGFVLVIACANVANLLLVRGNGRQQELAIRAALGASRARLLRQLLTESLLLAFCGGAFGLVVAWAGVQAIAQYAPADVPRLGDGSLNGAVLGAAIALALLTGLAFGLMPARYAAAGRMGDAVKQGSRGSTGGRAAARVRDMLVVAEVSLSLVLLIGAGLLVASLLRLHAIDPGFEPRHLQTARLELPEARYGDTEQVARIYGQLIAELKSVPGATHAAATTALPFADASWGKLLTIDGRPAPKSFADVPVVQYRQVTATYFETLRAPLRAGRLFAGTDGAHQPPVAIVNETFARRFWPTGGAVGATLYAGPPEALIPEELRENARRFPFPRLRVVGVVGDLRHYGLDPAPAGTVRRASAERHRNRSVHVRGRPIGRRSHATTLGLASAVHRIDPNLPLSDVLTMEDRLGTSLARRRFTLALMVLFAGVAVVMAVVGIYGVIAYTVGQRVREMGVRMALGARSSDIVKLIVTRGAWLALVGVAAGTMLAVALSGLMAGLLFEVQATDTSTYVATTVLLFAVAALAAYVPARRAGRIDPAFVLRHE